MLGKRRGFIDLGAERDLLAAEKGKEKIAVEIKSFLGYSDVDQFEDALGQYLLYKPALEDDDAYFQRVAKLYDVKIIIFDENKKTILEWKSWKNTKRLSNKSSKKLRQ